MRYVGLLSGDAATPATDGVSGRRRFENHVIGARALGLVLHVVHCAFRERAVAGEGARQGATLFADERSDESAIARCRRMRYQHPLSARPETGRDASCDERKREKRNEIRSSKKRSSVHAPTLSNERAERLHWRAGLLPTRR